MAPPLSTRTIPNRSASMPANGWASPHRMFWIASARPNTSRPQPLACDCGVRNRPRMERGPKLIIAIRQPLSTITAGVRQPITGAAEWEGAAIAINCEPMTTPADENRQLRAILPALDRGPALVRAARTVGAFNCDDPACPNEILAGAHMPGAWLPGPAGLETSPGEH